nr:sugar transferase [Alicyclobacillus ferrooxydans]
MTDVVFSVAILILLCPALVLIALAVKLDDGGPIIFSQLRSGIHGKTFRMYKFRSMRAEQRRCVLN